ncbi:MAG: 16S rRNA (cytidine(1402)-2'-O)-methyltransferase, partial [Bacteroidetes bacterium]
ALEQMQEVFGPERPVVVARELTKAFEEVRRGTVTEVLSYVAGQYTIRGEIVLVVGGAGTRATLWAADED